MESVKGFKDYVGKDAEKREEIRKILVDTFETYGFEPAETPVVEYEEFVKGENENTKNKKFSVSKTSEKQEVSYDEAVSDIFRLEDKGKRKLALRYELTFPLKRIMQNKKLPYKRYQIGPVFRDEPIQGNRTRQFIACDADIIGSSVKDEAEILSIVKNILNRLKIEFIIYINNRKLLNEILNQYGVRENNRKNVIRELDKLDKIPEDEIKKNLKKYRAENIVDVLKNKESFFEQFSSYKEVKELKDYCKYYGIEVKFLPMLARGLSYYNGNVFEVKTKAIKETICGGGSFMFNGIQATGFGTGLERLEILSNLKNEKEKYLIISLGKDKEVIQLAEKIRKKGKVVSIYYGKPSKALDYANSYSFNKIVFVGEKEIKSKKFKIKDMKSGKEKLLDLFAKF